MKLGLAGALSLLIALGAAGPAAAQCGLTLVASYDMVPTEYGQIGVKMQIGDEEKLMIVDTGAWFSFLSADVVDEMKLPKRSMSGQFVSYDTNGGRTSTVATAPSIMFGPVRVTSVDFVVAPAAHHFGKGIAGLIGANMIKGFDVELDFAGHKINFFDQGHCPGQVVYWTQGGSAHIPFKFDGSKISLPVKLDGKDLWAELDTGAGLSTLSRPMARQIFDIAPDSPKVAKHEYTRDDGSKGSDPAYTFQSLSFGGVTIAYPELYLVQDKLGQAARADNARTDYTDMPSPHLPTILLGIAELKHLRVYIAFREKVLYVTSADAR